MRVVNYTEFRNNLAESLNIVNDDGDIVIVSRSKGKNVVVMSLEEYNSIQ
jgi:antitoxin YefM